MCSLFPVSCFFISSCSFNNYVSRHLFLVSSEFVNFYLRQQKQKQCAETNKQEAKARNKKQRAHCRRVFNEVRKDIKVLMKRLVNCTLNMSLIFKTIEDFCDIRSCFTKLTCILYMHFTDGSEIFEKPTLCKET